MSMAGAGAAANVVGGELQGWASVLDKWNMLDAYAAEQKRQQGYKDQALGDFNTRLPGYGSDAANTALKTNTADRLSMYNKLGQAPLGINPSWQKSTGGDSAIADVMNRARAGNAAYGDWTHQIGQQQTEQERALNALISNAKGIASVFPYRMYQAQHSNDDLAMIGQAISSIGGGSTNYSQFAGQPQMQQQQMQPMYQQSQGFWGDGGAPASWTTQGGAAEGTLVAG